MAIIKRAQTTVPMETEQSERDQPGYSGEALLTVEGNHKTGDFDDYLVPLGSTREEGVMAWKPEGLLAYHWSGEVHFQ